MSVARLRIAARRACIGCKAMTNATTPAGRACCPTCWPAIKAELKVVTAIPMGPSWDMYDDVETIRERVKTQVNRFPVGSGPGVTFWNERDRDGRKYSGYDRDWSTLPLDRRER